MVRTTTTTTSACRRSRRRARLASPRRRCERKAGTRTPASVPRAGPRRDRRVRNERMRDGGHGFPHRLCSGPLRVDRSPAPPGAVMASGTADDAPPPTKRRDRTHWLYLAVIGAVLAGIAVGFAFPEFATGLKWLGTAFVGLIKMLIGPVIFCTIVLGIGAIRQAAKVGRIGGLALGYFLLMSTVALTIGLIVGNILHPGDGLQLSDELRGQGAELASTAEGGGGTTGFLIGLIPTTLLSALTEGSVLQALLVALLVGFAIQSLGRSGEPVLRAVGYL